MGGTKTGMNFKDTSYTGFSQTVLVTGGGGFLGSAIVGRLIEKGHRVQSFSRRSYAKLDALGVKQIIGDIKDSEAVASAVKGCDIVFHTAAKAGIWGNYTDYYDINVGGAQNVIRACLENPGTMLIHTSSPSVIFDGNDMENVDESYPYPDRYLAHYPQTKALAEKGVIEACRKGLKAIVIRPHLIWGPYDNHLVPRIIARGRRLIRIGDGANLVDTVYIDNAAEAHILAAEKLSANPELSGRIYFISQDEPIRLWEMIDAILDAGGLPPVKHAISRQTGRMIGAFCEYVYKMLTISKEPPMTRFVAEELATSHWFNISAAKKDLGYIPKISTSEGLLRLKHWLAARSIDHAG